MPISWNEIRHNAIGFAHEWAGARSETAEKQTFWNEFFQVFGLRRRTVATFEEPVKSIAGRYGFIDLFWPGTLLVEHKSRGKDLGKAESQAFAYIRDLLAAGRQDEVPRYVIVTDFARVALHDLEPDDQCALPLPRQVKSIEFPLAELHEYVHDFAFIPGYKQHRFVDQDPINLKAVAILGDLHDALDAGGYSGHELERFLVRVLFCLFAEDTGIFEREAFRLYLEDRTKPDGSDLGPHLARLFEVLNTPDERRQANLDEALASFRYVNGALFAETLHFADFNRDMRDALLACTRFRWAEISPAIFGSLFQAVMEKRERRQIGGHYTSERDILKVVRSLFLDDLREHFQRIQNSKAELQRFHEKLGSLRFFDPACGCGNFLVVTYRELRLLEIEVLKALHGRHRQRALDIQHYSKVDVDAFYGIEISEWPARIAEVAMWLMDHQMNLRLSEAFGESFVRLPLTKSATIVCGNALRLEWKTILPPSKCSYILGNPPFVGKRFQTAEQKQDMKLACRNVGGASVLDYVTCWYFKAAEYIQGTTTSVGFVSTNSITQGEQVGTLWRALYGQYRVKINFAHRTFRWMSEARGMAHVHVVIIGFAAFDSPTKRITDYEPDGEDATVFSAARINPYLVDGPEVFVLSRSHPLSAPEEIHFGSMPNDGGNLVLTEEEKTQLAQSDSRAAQFIRPYLGSEEFINGIQRWCLWLEGVSPAVLRSMPQVMRRVQAVRSHRASSTREATARLASTAAVFGEIRQPTVRYLAIPKTSSENRRYIPMAFLTPETVCNTELFSLPNATLYHFGVLTSAMHMAWVRQVCGRLKSDYRYSSTLVYNNFPWPESPSEKSRSAVAKAAQAVLEARQQYLDDGAALADVYDPLAMPPKLVKTHAALDRTVDLCYRPQSFASERGRVEFLFALYEKLTAPLMPVTPKRRAHSQQ